VSSLNSVIDIANASAQQQDPSFDVRKNLIGNFGDDWINYAKAPTGTTLADLNNAPSLFLFAAPNPDQAVIAIKNIAALSSQTGAPPARFLPSSSSRASRCHEATKGKPSCPRPG